MQGHISNPNDNVAALSCLSHDIVAAKVALWLDEVESLYFDKINAMDI